MINKNEQINFIDSFLSTYVLVGQGREDIAWFINKLLEGGYFCDDMLYIDNPAFRASDVDSIFLKVIINIGLKLPSFEEALTIFVFEYIRKIMEEGSLADGYTAYLWVVLEKYRFVAEGNMVHVFDLDDLLNLWLERLYHDVPQKNDKTYCQKLSKLAHECYMQHDKSSLYNAIKQQKR